MMPWVGGEGGGEEVGSEVCTCEDVQPLPRLAEDSEQALVRVQVGL